MTNATARRVAFVAALALASTAATCGPTKYRLGSPEVMAGSPSERPCVFLVDHDEWKPGHLTQQQCGMWTDRNEFDIIDAELYAFPHMLVGSSGRMGVNCPDCWVEIERPHRKAEGDATAWKVALHVPPNDEVIAVYSGGYERGLFAGAGTLELTRTAACSRYCQDFFAVDGDVANRLTITGAWADGYLADRAFQASYILHDGATYAGQATFDAVRGVLPHGDGARTDPDGVTYRGQFQRGQPEGEGVAEYPDGTRYEGAFLKGEWHGDGALQLPDGSSYVGQFRMGVRTGEGTQRNPDGSSHAGGWRTDQPHGEGERLDARGVRWRGVWQGGELAPDDVQIAWPDGLTYRGAISDRLPHGGGEMQWPSGQRYWGGWEHGRMSGLGRFDWADGVVYVGNWREGAPHGCGLLTDPDGAELVATFDAGELTAAGCEAPLSPWPAEALALLGQQAPAARALINARYAQRRTVSARRDADERAERLRGRFLPVMEVPPTETAAGGDEPAEPPGVEVRVRFAWPDTRLRRLVHPRCVQGEGLRLTVAGDAHEAQVGGVVDAVAVLPLPPGTTSKLCAEVDGPCGGGQGCATVDVPAGEPDGAVEVRVLLEPLPETPDPTPEPAPPSGDEPEPAPQPDAPAAGDVSGSPAEPEASDDEDAE